MTKPMKLTDVGPEVAESYITNPQWVMSQKLDGTRMLVKWDGENILFTNDGVKPIAFSAAKLKLPQLEEELRHAFAQFEITSAVFDGELIIEGGEYIIFDVIELSDDRLGSIVQVEDDLMYRLTQLRVLFNNGFTRPHVLQAIIATNEEDKRKLWAKINSTGVEGAVSKLLSSMYEPGIRTKNWVKHKLVKTADVVVTSVDRKFDHKGMVTHGSASIAVPIPKSQDPEPWVSARGKRAATGDTKTFTKHDPRELLPVGNVSLIGKELTIEVGSVVEIRYLYWTGQAVIQPAILRQRFDKPASDCDLQQFPLYTREVVAL